MKLYMFEHCSLCFRVRMTASLKKKHLQEVIVQDDDTPTLTALVGKRVIPILVKDCGYPMLESMDMVKYIDKQGESVFVGKERREVEALMDHMVTKTGPLTMPRYPLLGLPEFSSVAALDHYTMRKRKSFGDFVELRSQTRHHIDELMPDLEKLDAMIESPKGVNGKLSLDDVRVLPLLRSAAIVKGVHFPKKVREYFETMMESIGFKPLPVV